MKMIKYILMLSFFAPAMAFAQFSFGGWFANDPLPYWKVVIKINKAPKAQYMDVYVDGKKVNHFKVSTGRSKMEKAKSGEEYFSGTPKGWFTPTYQEVVHKSKKWEVDMPFATFIIGGIAIHGIPESLNYALGTPASGGCIRLKLENAKYIFDLVQKAGYGKVPVVSQSGSFSRNFDGSVKMRNARRVIVILED